MAAALLEITHGWLVIGLGNPGKQYAGTRHNLGFLVADELLRRYPPLASIGNPSSVVVRIVIGGSPVILAKPMTYMNRSGAAVASLIGRFPEHRILVIHDDLDLAEGRMKLKRSGGDGGHLGLRSIVEELGHGNFARLRLGIGRPADGDVVHYVLEALADDPLKEHLEWARNAAPVVEQVVREGLTAAMNRVNRRVVEAREFTGFTR